MLVECVPNFSEGRKTETIDRLAEAVESEAGVVVLNRHVDIDHNRVDIDDDLVDKVDAIDVHDLASHIRKNTVKSPRLFPRLPPPVIQTTYRS